MLLKIVKSISLLAIILLAVSIIIPIINEDPLLNQHLHENVKDPQNILVVGGTGGIGRAIIEKLAVSSHKGSHFTVVGRNRDAVTEIKSTTGCDNVHFIHADVSLLSEVRRVVSQYASEHKHLHTLVLTQGVLTMDHILTKENIDYKLALHYYSRMQFIKGLMPLLEVSKNAKVLSVLDAKRGDINQVDWDDMSLEKSYSLIKAATHAITFNDIMIQKFAKDHENISFFHAYPGIVSTDISSSLPWYLRHLASIMMSIPGISVSPSQCADYMIKAMNTKVPARWANLDNKGNIIQKGEIDQDIMRKLDTHTDAILNNGL